MMSAFRYIVFQPQKLWLKILNRNGSKLGTSVVPLHFNPLSPNSDQHQFSPNNIHRLSSATSMRINQMITKRKIFDLLSISPN